MAWLRAIDAKQSEAGDKWSRLIVHNLDTSWCLCWIMDNFYLNSVFVRCSTLLCLATLRLDGRTPKSVEAFIFHFFSQLFFLVRRNWSDPRHWIRMPYRCCRRERLRILSKPIRLCCFFFFLQGQSREFLVSILVDSSLHMLIAPTLSHVLSDVLQGAVRNLYANHDLCFVFWTAH